MTAVADMRRWLGTLDAERLTCVLKRRPDAAGPTAPRDLGELADRLSRERSVAEAFTAMVLPAVQVAEALQALGAEPGAGVRRSRLAALLGVDEDDAGLDATLTVLAEWALAWQEGHDIHLALPLTYAFASPLRLGEPARQLLADQTVAQLRQIAGALGVPAPMGKEKLLDAVGGALRDAGFVRTIAASAPEAARDMLAEVAHDGPLISGVFVGLYPAAGPPTWALERGLLVQAGWDSAEMPREVALALRGPQWRAPFDPVPPTPRLAPLPPDAVARDAAAAASAALDQVAAVLDACGSGPVAVRKAGGVGAREVRRLAKVTGAEERLVRLWLEVAAAAGLLAVTVDGVLPTGAYDEWLSGPPAERLARLVEGWAASRSVALASGRTPLLPDQFGNLFAALRGALLRVLRGLPPGLGVTGDLAPLVTWHAPLLATAFGDEAPDLIAALVAEAEALGVAARGAISPLGTVLADGVSSPAAASPSPADAANSSPPPVDPALLAAAGRLVAPALAKARFQADLTVVVAGTPDRELADLLDSCADRESRGAASIWRLSAASVRRALDSGLSAAGLLARLRAVAADGALPQPVAYLFGDAERRHGTVRVRPAGSVIHSEDTALLAEIAAARGLRTLSLSPVAPTVLVSARPPTETLAALRTAGYAPAAEDGSGTVQVERAARRRAPTPPPPRRTPAASSQPSGRPDLAALAEALVAADEPPPPRSIEPASYEPEYLLPNGPAGPRPRLRLLTGGGGDDDPPEQRPARPRATGRPGLSTVPGTADLLAQRAPQLSAAEIETLRAAIENRTPVEIVYLDTRGVTSTRLIDTIEPHGQVIEAWCHLRNDDRAFALSRIQAVHPA